MVSKVTSSVGEALSGAIAHLREELDDPSAPVAVIVPSSANGTLVRRALAQHEQFLRVWFQTAEELARAAVPDELWTSGLRPEPAGWLRATLGAILREKRELLGRFVDTLNLPGWRDPLAQTIAHLELEGVDPAELSPRGAPEHLAERIELLKGLMLELHKRRARDRLLHPSAVATSAHATLKKTGGVAASLATGAVVIGDNTLALASFEFLQGWLALRPTVLIVQPPSAALQPATRGLICACPPKRHLIELGPAGEGALARVQETAFSSSTSNSFPPDDTVVFARPPDEVRECTECVREVQRAIRRETALDRIAIVLPDSATVGPLEEALARAGIPGSWLVTRPLRESAPAQLIELLLDVAQGNARVATWYDLLRHPAIQLTRQKDIGAVEGRGRWRRFLANRKNVATSQDLLAALRADGRKIEEEAADLTGEDADRAAKRLASLQSLQRAIRALVDFATVLDVRRTWAEHGRAWAQFLRRYGRRSQVSYQLIQQLESLGPLKAGPNLTLGQARHELDAVLDQSLPIGNMTDAAVKVVSPMNLMGGSFDLVCVLGLTEARFPTKTPEPAILSTELIEHINVGREHKVRLPKDHEDAERRRFTACISATTKKLWLSSCAAEFTEQRPTLPSTFLLEVLGSLIDGRSRYSDLEGRWLRVGRRSRVVTKDPDDALGISEHHAAHAIGGSPKSLTSSRYMRGVVRQQLSLFKSINDPEFVDSHTGLIAPTTLSAPGLDGTPIALEWLASLLRTPSEFLIRQMLGAYPSPRLTRPPHPLRGWSWNHRVMAAIDEALTRASGRSQGEREESFRANLEDALNNAVRDASRFTEVTTDEQEAAAKASLELTEPLIDQQPELAGSAPILVPGAVLLGHLPWRIEGVLGRVITLAESSSLARIAMEPTGPRSSTVIKDPISALAAVASALEGPTELRVVGPKSFKADDIPELATAMREELDQATELARAGRFVLQGSRSMGLGPELAEVPRNPEGAFASGEDE